MIFGVNPCTADEAVDRLRSMVGVDMPYRLGSGDYAPRAGAGGIIDAPWTADRFGVVGSDCAGAICFAYKLRRSRPGFNRNRPGTPRPQTLGSIGAPPTVVDDINTNSMIEDAEYTSDLFVPVPIGAPILAGDLLCYPTIQLRDDAGDWIRDASGKPKQWIGHVQMAIEPTRTVSGGPYADCIIAQCCGGEDRRPAIVTGYATHMDEWAKTWPKFQHTVKVLRVRSDIAIVG